MNRIFFKNWPHILLYFLFVAISSGGFIIGSFFLSRILNASIQKDINELVKQVSIVAGLYFFGALFMQVSAVYKAKLIFKFNNQLRRGVTKKILSLTIKEFKDNSVGGYVSWYTNDVTQIQLKVFESFLEIFQSITSMILAIISIVLLHWIIGLFAIGYILLMIFIPKIFDKLISRKAIEFSESQEVFSQTVNDKVSGYEEFYNYNLLSNFLKIIGFSSTKLEKSRYDYQIAETKHNSLIISVSILGQFLAIFLTAYLAALDFTDFGSVLSIASLSGTFFISTRESAAFGVRILSNKKLFNKFKYDPQNKFDDVNFEINSISINNLTFGYNGNKVFENLNLELSKNKKYLITGQSGRGKSTLLKILFGHIEDYSGDIIFNKTYNYKKINKIDVQSQIAYISQGSHLFNDTLKNNLCLFSDQHSEKDMMNVIKKVNLWDWYLKLEKGLDEVIEDKSKNVSGGERQRILIARALLKNKKILFMDEATANLDKQNALQIDKMILGYKDITVVVINHNVNPETVNSFDKIIKL